MARIYQKLWDTLKKDNKAEALVAKDRLATVRQAVIKLKCEENVRRIRAGKPSYGKLVITVTEISPAKQQWKITFELTRNPEYFRSILS